jgi:general secretion pathway protein K
MRIPSPARPSGIAMIIVMIVIVVLGILAGGFAYSMKVETKLAQNSGFETDLEWIGRSGVELARYVLVHSMNIPGEPWDSLNQKWAGGPRGTNEILDTVSLENNQLGPGSFSIRITDLERKVNINHINEVTIPILQQALNLADADPGSIQTISDSFLDWIDLDEDPHLSGTESADYMVNPNPGYTPHMAKNGLIDDLAELLLIRGVTPDIFFGSGESDAVYSTRSGFIPGPHSSGPVGLIDLFTPLSSGMVNINTTSAEVLQLLPAIDSSLAQAIIMTRAGLDGVDGTEDDMPFRTLGELMNVPGMPPGILGQFQGMLATRSFTFEVIVDTRIGSHQRQFVAVLRRNPSNPRDLQTLLFHWK